MMFTPSFYVIIIIMVSQKLMILMIMWNVIYALKTVADVSACHI